MGIITPSLILFLSLFCVNAWATVPVQRFPSGTPVQVCVPSDTNVSCGGGGGGSSIGGAMTGGTQYYVPYVNPANIWAQSANLQFNGSVLSAPSLSTQGISINHYGTFLTVNDTEGYYVTHSWQGNNIGYSIDATGGSVNNINLNPSGQGGVDIGNLWIGYGVEIGADGTTTWVNDSQTLMSLDNTGTLTVRNRLYAPIIYDSTLGGGNAGDVLTSDGGGGAGDYWAPSSSMVYPGNGIAVAVGGAWTTSLSAPASGNIAGTTDTQALTHKDLTDSTNTFPTKINNAVFMNIMNNQGGWQ